MDRLGSLTYRLRRVRAIYGSVLRHSRPRHTVNTFLNHAERRVEVRRARSYPRILQVEVTNRCNLNCLFCSRYYQPLKLGDFPESLVPEVEKTSERVLETILFGYGEPLVADVFYTLLRRVRSSRISFISNGYALTPDTLDRILNTAARPLYNIALSIDGAYPDRYNEIRKRSDFETVWRNLENLCRVSKATGRPSEVWIDFVAMRSNAAELPDLIRKAASVGVSQLNVFHLVVWNDRYRDESLLHDPGLNREVFEEARRVSHETGVVVDLPVTFDGGGGRAGDAAGGQDGFPRCTQPWAYCYIRHDGSLHVCCHAEDFVMGNLHEQSFDEIWNGSRYRNFRGVVNRRLPADCLRCELRFRYCPSPDDGRVYLKGKPRDM